MHKKEVRGSNPWAPKDLMGYNVRLTKLLGNLKTIQSLTTPSQTVEIQIAIIQLCYKEYFNLTMDNIRCKADKIRANLKQLDQHICQQNQAMQQRPRNHLENYWK